MRSLKTLLYTSALLLVLGRLCIAQDLPVMDGLQVWLDATDASTVFQDFDFEDPASDGDFMAAWMDKSGNDFHAFTADAAEDPTYVNDGINSLPSVRFEGGEFASGMVIEELDVQRPYTAFIVNQYWDEASRGRTLQSTDTNWLLGLWAGNFGHYAEGWVNSPQPAADVGRPYVADAVGTETESFFNINGVDWTTNSSPSGAPGGLAIAAAGQFPGEVSDADVSEIIIYDRALSTDELSSMRTHLYDKYGTTPVDEPPPPAELIVHKGAIGTFSSASDLDFSGDFKYAINAAGPGFDDFGDDLVIGDAVFAEGTIAAQDDLDDAGAVISRNNEAPTWYGDPDYGDTDEDENLELIMRSIRWSTPDMDGVAIDLDVEEGESYKLQMLFAEEAWDRGFDIFAEDEEVVSDFVIHLAQGGFANRQVGVSYTLELTAGDDELNILLGGSVAVPDNNPLFQAITLEKIEGIVVPTCEDIAATRIPGDANGNNEVEFLDFLVLSNNFGLPGGYDEGDFNCSGVVEFLDFLILSNNFGATAAGTASSIPEPAGFVLFGFAGLLVGLLRRGRN